ncbi:hypothetical protein M670_01640 [Schinkia azotoformans MEV2011]|uniref:Uncharacterized protein n=2 Tax=Schinkia azotoformans TaxID=1454 RepID=A0A072NPS1_SCHAZ|nr:hypothetical protein M670_01640 [Schinkia azotoformans MEV2011]
MGHGVGNCVPFCDREYIIIGPLLINVKYIVFNKYFERGGQMYFLRSISDDIQVAQLQFRNLTKTRMLVLGAFLACLAAVLQAAGGFLPGIGYFISPFATLPILICAMFSLSVGVMSYFLTILLLFILVPSELNVFPFTTGLLGIGIGGAFSFFKKRASIIFVGAILLTTGIISLLYIFRFPVLGPAVSYSFSYLTTGGIFLFALFYNWLWVEIALFFFKRLRGFII